MSKFIRRGWLLFLLRRGVRVLPVRPAEGLTLVLLHFGRVEGAMPGGCVSPMQPCEGVQPATVSDGSRDNPTTAPEPLLRSLNKVD